MANRTDKFAKSIHGTNPQNLVEKITRNKIQASVYWKEQCFGLSAETMIDRAVELRSIGGMYGEPNKPTEFVCLILKMLQIQPSFDIVVELIRNEDYKYVRLLGAFYLRLTGRALDVYTYLEPLYNDFRKVRVRSSGGAYVLSHVDAVVDDMLRRDYLFDIALPHIPNRVTMVNTGQLEPRVSVLDEEFNEQATLEALEAEAGEAAEKAAALHEVMDAAAGGGAGGAGGGGGGSSDDERERERREERAREKWRLNKGERREQRDRQRGRSRSRSRSRSRGRRSPERDRDRRRGRSRSRSRSRSRERGGYHRSRSDRDPYERGGERERDRDRDRGNDRRGGSERERGRDREQERGRDRGGERGGGGGGGGKARAADPSDPEIAEQNALRAKLGLPPLR
ncbi:pre-mRNA-splicing factor [Raphidocelis subcapitata]|uniref:Pre-mRNA-splicing factor 38 n=1 Tax=Raphidocelis subcapitata TaxID=307507 RepID=A0A2V0PFS0_9CHLO|nr:pre-mRNA-splicing factor [Raphidocelis subcapitata]|eukprot:GBF98636.1 pre-mRNA-splicing factor [Raphidocelis subcapitata]